MHEDEPGAEGARQQSDDVRNAVVTRSSAALRNRDHVRHEPLVGTLGSVGRRLQQEIEDDDQPVGPR